tara:strand:- start:1706 stop:2686 length:981 start_codon:yes stop_codon:yes gene_type:complete
MTLFEEVDIMNTPNAFKSGKLYSVKPSSGLADLSISRSTTATRVNSAGTIETLAVDVPQLDYTDSSCPSFLIEPQRTNLAFPSATAVTQTVTTSAAAYTLSFYGTGSVTLSGTHSATLNGTGASNRVTLTFTPSSGSLTMTVAGTVTNIQLEAGDFASSLIPTTSASVTRNLTSFLKTGLSSLIGQTEGVFFIEIKYFGVPSGQNFLSIGQYAGGNNAVNIGNWGGNFSASLYFNNTTLFLNTNVATVDTNFHKIAVKYKSGDSAIWVDGVEVFTYTTTGTPSAAGFDTTSSKWGNLMWSIESVKIKQLQVYDTILTDAELLTLTT